ncbi:Glycosyl transferase, family 2 [Candidatus Sulfobium mesophilum]|uniref:Glycosyl transferase, family 2 n=1 Tax=Candidatus Sulfobium mesophilum TaxID=2016548 RepID=A0A2U3QDY2_9BACT|nr:Glycosyl transferase, family 2 [Candidatus Sulfobium mesophilum]
MNGQPAISVVIVNYNGLSHLQECLDSLRAQTFRDFETIFVDNASTDGSVEFVKNNFAELKVIRNEKNLGYGGGNNAGIRSAEGKYIAILNNDTKVDPDWLGMLFAAAEKGEGIGMCASKILNYYRPGIIDNTGLLLYKDGVARGRGRLERDTGQYDSEDEVFFPSGCAGLYRKGMLKEIGLLDEDFFLYVEDVDIGLRARLAGWRCVYVPRALVYHKYSATTEAYSPLKAYLVERNRIWVMMKCFPLSMIATSPFYTLLRYLLQGYGILTGRGASSRIVRSYSVWEGLKILMRSYSSAFMGCGKILKKRREIMGHKKVSGGDIADWFRRFGISAMEVALKE